MLEVLLVIGMIQWVVDRCDAASEFANAARSYK
jgi:hypothetical protein